MVGVAVVRERFVEAGVCPSCGAPAGEYEYVLEGPVYSGGSPWARISYSVRCGVCGYSEGRRVSVPLRALYLLRYLISPQARLAVEKIWLVEEVRSRGV